MRISGLFLNFEFLLLLFCNCNALYSYQSAQKIKSVIVFCDSACGLQELNETCAISIIMANVSDHSYNHITI